jgi:hypothetical protein
LEYLVGTQGGDIDESIAPVDADGMGIAARRDDLQGLVGDTPSLPTALTLITCPP